MPEKIVFLLHKPCEIVNVFLAMASFIVASGEIFVISLQNANFCVDAVLGGDDLSGRFRWLCGVSGRHGGPTRQDGYCESGGCGDVDSDGDGMISHNKLIYLKLFP